MLSRIIRGIRSGGGARVFATAAALSLLAACGRESSQPLVPPGPSPQPARVALNGVVREAGTMRFLSGARIVITSGPDLGASAVSDSSGAFRFPSLTPGPIDFESTKDGYLAARFTNIDVRPDAVIDVPLYAAPPLDAGGAPATARCNDSSWSWSQTPARACSSRGGVATAYVSAREL